MEPVSLSDANLADEAADNRRLYPRIGRLDLFNEIPERQKGTRDRGNEKEPNQPRPVAAGRHIFQRRPEEAITGASWVRDPNYHVNPPWSEIELMEVVPATPLNINARRCFVLTARSPSSFNFEPTRLRILGCQTVR